MPEKNTGKKSRLIEIDAAKGLAIILVVFGHIVARTPPADNEWYVVTKEALYSFHMAFFMYLSGIIFFLNARATDSIREYTVQVWKRFVRLMPAYFLFAGIVFLAKVGAQNLLHVDNPVSGLNDLINILLYPTESISAFLWYIYILFLFCTAGLAFISLIKKPFLLMIGIGIALLFVPQTAFLGMNHFCKYFLFFSLGGLAIQQWAAYSIIVDRTWKLATVLFIFLLVSSSYKGYGWIFIALISLIALHGLCKQGLPLKNLLTVIGRMSFPIYLMNTLCIGFVKAVMLKFISWDGLNFFFFAPILTLAGLWGPLLVKKHIIRRVKWLDKITT